MADEGVAALTATGAGGVAPRYEQWNGAIAERFFKPEYAGRPAYLAVDDEILEEVAPYAPSQGEDPATCFVRAIRPAFSNSSGYGLFARFFRARREWRAAGGHEPPPFMALLGLSVLAASRMARDPHGQIASHNYYVHYNRLIGQPDQAGRPRPIRCSAARTRARGNR